MEELVAALFACLDCRREDKDESYFVSFEASRRHRLTVVHALTLS